MKLTIVAPAGRLAGALHVAQDYLAGPHAKTARPRPRDCVLYSPPDGLPQTHVTAVWGTCDHLRVRVLPKDQAA